MIVIPGKGIFVVVCVFEYFMIKKLKRIK